jgi:hypothetical protein
LNSKLAKIGRMDSYEWDENEKGAFEVAMKEK